MPACTQSRPVLPLLATSLGGHVHLIVVLALYRYVFDCACLRCLTCCLFGCQRTQWLPAHCVDAIGSLARIIHTLLLLLQNQKPALL